MTTEHFSEIWEQLEEKSQQTDKKGILSIRIFPESTFDFFLGVQHPEKVWVFMIRIKKENIINQFSLPRSKGFDIKQVILPEDQGQSATIQFVLNDFRYKDIFTRVTEDIADYSLTKSSEKEMLNSLFSRLAMWQQFLNQYGPEGLSPNAQIGLFGELKFLKDYLLPTIGAIKAISAWTGPNKKQQDFQISNIAIEVKTSTAKQHQKVTIASEQQLDDNGLRALYMYHLSLREIQNGGLTLPKIIDKLRSEISEDSKALSLFENSLIQAGYLNEHREKYETTGYIDRKEQIFHIRDKFPRIIENDLIEGVGDVQYTVNISTCIPFNVDEITFREELERCRND